MFDSKYLKAEVSIGMKETRVYIVEREVKSFVFTRALSTILILNYSLIEEQFGVFKVRIFVLNNQNKLLKLLSKNM